MLDFNYAPRQHEGPKKPYMETGDPVAMFRAAMAEHGLHPGEIRLDGKVHRFDIDKPGDKAGFYKGYPDGVPSGYFGNHKIDFHKNWCSKSVSTFTQEELKQHQKRQKENKEERRQEEKVKHEKAKETASYIWRDSVEIVGQGHSYLAKKGIQAHHVRLSKTGDLVIPQLDENGVVWSLQFIKPDGEKKFLAGGRRDGLFFEILGKEGNEDIFLCEGFSTGATIAENTGATVICAFNAGSLSKVARVIRDRYPNKNYTIAADNDQFNPRGNVGIEKAKEAAKILGGCPVVSPTFKNIESKPTDFNDLAALEGVEAVKNSIEKALNAPATKKRENVFTLTRIGDIEVKAPQWLIKNHIELDTLNMYFGDPGAGKSFAAVDCAASVATGTSFFGRPVKKGPVIYIAGEGQNGIKRRFAAWGKEHGVDIDSADLFISLMPAALCDSEQTEQVLAAVRSVAQICGESPVLVILDTVARNFGPGDENSTTDMSRFIQAADRLRVEYSSAILLIHHSGHSAKDRARGAMALKGALDSEFRLEKDEDSIVRMINTKMKDFVPPEPISFTFKTIELDEIDEDGEPVTSAVFERTDFMPAPVLGKAGGGSLQIKGKEILKGLYKVHRENLCNGDHDPNQAKVSVKDWQEACKAVIDRKRFYDIKKSLTNGGEIKIENGFVYLK